MLIGNFEQDMPSLNGTLGGEALRGLSAYDIAIKNGFEGTEQEWLESLKGKDGASKANEVSAVVPEGLPEETTPDVQSILNALNKKPSGTQSDWNVNDPDDPAYVKNRFGGYMSAIPDSVLYEFEDLAETYVAELPGKEPESKSYLYKFRTNYLLSPRPFDVLPVLYINDVAFDFTLAKKYKTTYDPNKYWFIYGNPHYLLPYERNQLLNPPEDVDTGETYLYILNNVAASNNVAFGGNIERRRIQISINVKPQQAHVKVIGSVLRPVKISSEYLPFEGTTTVGHNDIFNDQIHNVATGGYDHAEGSGTTASGLSSHAEGYYTTASGDYSHAEGHSTTASGNYSSHAEGRKTTASGSASHSEGYSTTASSKSQHVEGKFNIPDTDTKLPDGTPQNKYAHIVGNGTYNKPSNAHTLDWEGNGWYQGRILVGGADMDAPASELTPNSLIIQASDDPSRRFKITVDSTGAIKAEEVIKA